MSSEKSNILIKIDGISFLIETNKFHREDKIDIAIIADNLQEFEPEVYKMSPYELCSLLETEINSRLDINAKVMSLDMEITIFSDEFSVPINDTPQYTYMGNNWFKVNIGKYEVDGKVYSEPSQYGIDNGQISKLNITDATGAVVCNFDRGWDVHPKNEYKELCEQAKATLLKAREDVDSRSKSKAREMNER